MTVSVVIPAGPDRRFLREAVLSALHSPEAEVIVVEDGGSTHTSIGDLPVRRLPSQGQGMAAARNTGMTACRTPYVTFLDCDDLLTPHSITWRLHWVRQRRAPWVAGLVEGFIDETGKSVSPPNRRPLPPLPPQLGFDFFRDPNPGIPLASWSVLGETETLPRFDESLRWVPDTAFLLDLVQRHPLPLLALPVIRYRLHDQNVSGRWQETERKIRPHALAEAHLLSLEAGVTP